MPNDYLNSPLIAKDAETAYLARQLAREFRKNPTPAEMELWRLINRKQILGLKFLRQRPFFFEVDNSERYYIVDFYCHEKRLVIEVDGGIHSGTIEYDQLRTLIITNHGYTELRFSNDAVLNKSNAVIQQIIETASQLPSILPVEDPALD